MRIVICLLCCLWALPCLAQKGANTDDSQLSQSTLCIFSDGKAIRLNYPDLTGKDITHNMAQGRVWAPNGKPMILVTDTELNSAGQTVKPGMYGVYIIPEKSTWTVVLSGHSEPVQKYDKSNDVARVTAETFPLPKPEEHLQVALVHRAPGQCNFRIYAGGTAAFGEFKEQR
jgi:hypothetical protein